MCHSFRPRRSVRAAAVAAVGAGFALTWQVAADVTKIVDNTGAGDYLTIQAAINAHVPLSGMTDNVVLQVRNTGVAYNRAGLADVNLTNGFSLTFQGINGRPTIQTAGANALLMYNNDNIAVENFNFVGSGGGYAFIENFGQNGRASNNVFVGGGSGILLGDNEWSRNLTVERNYYHGQGGSLVSDSATNKGGRPLSPIVIRNNVVKNASLFGVSNPVFGTDGNDFPDPDHPKDGSVYILNNSLRGHGSVVRIGNSSNNYQGFGLVVLNNAFEGLSGMEAYDLQGTEAPNGVFDHNIFSSLDNLARATYYELDPPQPPVNYPFTATGLNDWRTFLGGTAFGDEANSFIGDPGYLGPEDGTSSNPSEMDLAAMSAAIDAGAPLSYVMPNHMTLGQMLGTVDFFGRTRVAGSGVDIGAAEFAPPILYWDTNGVAAGAGGASPSGNWNGTTANFNSDAAGGAAGTLTAVTTAADTVVFSAGSDATGNYTVTLTGPRSAAQVTFEEGNIVTLTGGSLATGIFDASAGAHGKIESVVTGGPTGAVLKQGAGTVTLTGNNTYTGGTTVTAGTLQVNRLHENNAVTITGGTLRVLEEPPDLASGLPSGNNASVSRPSALTVAAGATLDLTNNDLVLDYTNELDNPAAAIEALIASGYNGGDWLGAGITSSVAQLDGNFALAIADNALLTSAYSSFSGQTVDTTTVLVKFTWVDDLDLDGMVTSNDAITFGNNYSPGDPARRATGDMDYDGVYTSNDAILFGNAYDTSLPSLPEPGTLGVLGLLLGLSRRSRKLQR